MYERNALQMPMHQVSMTCRFEKVLANTVNATEARKAEDMVPNDKWTKIFSEDSKAGPDPATDPTTSVRN
jgi:hypothetical protein